MHIHWLLHVMQAGNIHLEFAQIKIQSMTSNWTLHLEVASGVNNLGERNYLEHNLDCNELLDWQNISLKKNYINEDIQILIPPH